MNCFLGCCTFEWAPKAKGSSVNHQQRGKSPLSMDQVAWCYYTITWHHVIRFNICKESPHCQDNKHSAIESMDLMLQTRDPFHGTLQWSCQLSLWSQIRVHRLKQILAPMATVPQWDRIIRGKAKCSHAIKRMTWRDGGGSWMKKKPLILMANEFYGYDTCHMLCNKFFVGVITKFHHVALDGPLQSLPHSEISVGYDSLIVLLITPCSDISLLLRLHEQPGKSVLYEMWVSGHCGIADSWDEIACSFCRWSHAMPSKRWRWFLPFCEWHRHLDSSVLILHYINLIYKVLNIGASVYPSDGDAPHT